MKFKDKYNIAPEFESIFAFESKEEELEHEAKMIMFRFLSELEKSTGDKPLVKKELAKAIQTSASYITQLYQGDKLLNLITLAKIQDAYDIIFEIKAKTNSENYKAEMEQTPVCISQSNQWNNKKGYWVYVPMGNDYKNVGIEPVSGNDHLKTAV